MKNNEYNIVNITNEKSNFSAEYTNAQKAEYSFQSENKNPFKDELNDNSTINDKVEDNLSKATKEKEKKKEKQESEALESSSSSSSAASSGASTTASSTAAASSAGGAGALGGIVAAATVSVAAIGTIVGINVMGPAQKAELATFLTSEVTPNSIDFSFSMPSRLLRYEEEGGQNAPIGEKIVVFEIANGSGFKKEEPLPEYEEYDEEHFIYYGYMGGLTPDTSYALTVSIKEYIPEYEEPIYNELGKRIFSTQAIPVTDDFRFETVEASTTKVNFSFIVSNAALEYTPGETDIPVVNATITSNFGYEDTISIEQLTEFDESSMIGSGEFTGLTPSTTYTITISAELESGYKSFGYTSVTTENAVTFDTVEATHSSVNFSFIVDNEAVEYDPSLARMPAIQATISDGADFYDEMWIEQISTYDDSNLMGSGNFTGLSANTEYTITLYVSLEQELRTLGSTSFTTSAKPSTGFRWGIFTLDVEETVLFRFYVKSSYIGFEEGGPTPNCYAVVTLNGQEVKRSSEITYSTYEPEIYDDACFAQGTIDGLDGSTTYKLTIYFVDGQNVEALGDPKEFTTKESSPTFYFAESQYQYIGDDYISPLFYIKKTEVQEVAGATASGSNINVSISGGMAYTQTVNIAMSDFSEPQDTSYYMARPTFENLDSNIEYTIAVSNTITGENYGSSTFTTTDSRGIGFVISAVTPTINDVQASFYLNTSYVSDTNNVSATVITKEGTTVSSATARLTGTEDSKHEFSVNVSGLSPQTDYTIGFYYSNTLVGISEFTTEEYTGPTFYRADISPNVSFSAHVFEISLNYVDDESQPTFTALKIQFYSATIDAEDRSRYILESPIDLMTQTDAQPVSLPSQMIEGEIEYLFEFGDIKSYDVLNGDDVIYQSNITFVDTDPAGTIDSVSSQISASIDTTNNYFYLVFKITYTDDYDNLGDLRISVTPDQAGAEESSKADISKTTDYQLATFEDNSQGDQGVVSYLGSGNMAFTVNIYKYGQDDPIYTQENVTVVKESSNIFYSGAPSKTEFSEDDIEFGFDNLVYVCGDPNKLSAAQVVFIDESSQEEYKWDYPLGNPSHTAPTFSLMAAVATPDFQNFESYSDIKAALSGKTFEIVIRFINASQSGYENYPMGTGVSFTFN